MSCKLQAAADAFLNAVKRKGKKSKKEKKEKAGKN